METFHTHTGEAVTGERLNQAFNALIGNKPKGNDMTLDQKIEAQRLWKAQCDDAYNAVKQSVGA
jgi:hypothetical protein